MGWKFVYLLDEEAPAEIPVEINAFKAQQRRWAKGVMQVGLKLYPRIWRARLPLRVRLEMFFRLTGNISYPLMIVASFLQFPLVTRALQSAVLPPDDSRLATAFLFLSVRVSFLRHGGLVPRQEAHAAPLAPAARNGARHRPGFFQRPRRAGSLARDVRVGICAHAQISGGKNQDETWKRKKYKRKRGLLPLLELGFSVLLPAGNSLRHAHAHVGHSAFPAPVFLRLRLHGRHELRAVV